MASAEIVFEYLALALESTKGTAIAVPTHYLPFAGKIKPAREKYRTRDSNGQVAGVTRSKTVRASGPWDGEGAADPNYAPVLFNTLIKSVTSPTTPTNGVLTRLWTFAPTMNANVAKSATFYFGDPNVQIWQSTYCMANQLTITGDAMGTDAVTWSMDGFARFPTRVSAPTLPAQQVGSLLMPGYMQLWIDTSSAIGTTEVTGRLASMEVNIPTGLVPKYYAGGPTGGLNFSSDGIGSRSAKLTFSVELNTTSIGASKEYQQWEADTQLKVRARWSGSLIESVTPDYYEYIQCDLYGPLDALDWGDAEGTNRLMKFEVTSELNSYAVAAGYDFALAVQNQKTTL